MVLQDPVHLGMVTLSFYRAQSTSKWLHYGFTGPIPLRNGYSMVLQDEVQFELVKLWFYRTLSTSDWLNYGFTGPRALRIGYTVVLHDPVDFELLYIDCRTERILPH